jgi:xanthine dehydrogenase small subunit
MNETNFELNGRTVDLGGTEPTESLLRWLLRSRLTGTKEGCADGDCGACTVALVDRDVDGKACFQAVNSCLLPMGALPGRAVVTVEALAHGEQLHPVQSALVDCAGSQCGYCTPGFVMSLFVGYYAGELSDHTTEGNLCRCTGYQPIRNATRLLAERIRPDDEFSARLSSAAPAPASARLGEFHSPTSIGAALALKAAHAQAAWICGATDLGVNLSHGQAVAPGFIALDRIAELQTLEIGDDEVRIGAGVPLSRLETELAGVFPALDEMLRWFAARQVRNRATFGGNLGSASPIGDLNPILLALDATIELAGPGGTRDVPADEFFFAYRKTARAADELIVAVRFPRSSRIQASYKVAKRQTDDISIVAAVFALERDGDGRVTHVRLAYGGVAAIPLRARATEAFLLGKVLDDACVAEAVSRLEAEFTPLSDHRSGAEYRRKLSGSLFAKFVAERGS